jgi:RNA polymerase sigma-70 factor (ECF subfamily)
MRGTDGSVVSAASLTSKLTGLLGSRAARNRESFEDHPSPLTSKSLLAAAQRGDRAALGALLRELQDPWYRLSVAMLRDAELAAESVQETGLRFLRQLAGFRGDSQLRTWSLGIAINVVRELKRRRSRLTCVGDPANDLAEPPGDNTPHASTGLERMEDREIVRRLLVELPDRQREAVVLRFFEDLSVEETAELMGCATGTVKATVHQALRSLRKRLGN